MLKTGKFDSRTTPREYHIPPFGYADLGAGVGTLSLVSCDAVALQLVCDGHAMRLNEGSTMPMNGHNRYLRNPYSRHVRCETLEDLPVSIGRRHSENDTGFAGFHNHTFRYRRAQTGGWFAGSVLMAKRGAYSFKIEGEQDMSVFLLPDAHPNYAERLPAGVLHIDGPQPISSTGLENEQMVVRSGKFQEASFAEWIENAGWTSAPRQVSEEQGKVEVVVPENTAILMRSKISRLFNVNCVLTDLGDWNPQLDG